MRFFFFVTPSCELFGSLSTFYTQILEYLLLLELLLLLLVIFASKRGSAQKQCGLREHSSLETHGTHDAATRCQPVWCNLLQTRAFAVLCHLVLSQIKLSVSFYWRCIFWFCFFFSERRGKLALGWFRRYQCVEKSMRMSKLSSHSSVP